MSNEEKQLLLKDLCTRLPYGVIIFYANGKTIEKRELGLGSLHDFMFDNAEVKPYLRPMSSMTEEEIDELTEFHVWNNGESIFLDCDCEMEDISQAIDWLNAHHFDYRGLIEKGLALEALEDMYK